jgi:queuine tRNA-ribosyltransferase
LPAEQSVENGIMKFDLLKDPLSKARQEVLLTDHGVIETPIFVVGTVASVGVHQRE